MRRREEGIEEPVEMVVDVEGMVRTRKGQRKKWMGALSKSGEREEQCESALNQAS